MGNTDFRVRQSPRDTLWFTVGDITLCCYCRRAIQLRRVKIQVIGWCDVWVHFPGTCSHPIGRHAAQPVWSWAEAAMMRDPIGQDSIVEELIGNVMLRQPRPVQTVYLPGDQETRV